MRPDTVQLVALVVVQVSAPGAAAATYRMMIDPPSEIGGDHETAIAVLTAVVAKDVGGPGRVALAASARAMPPGISVATATAQTAARAMPFETLTWCSSRSSVEEPKDR
jgi:hypothetical protein